MNVTQNEMDTGAIAIKEYLEDGRIEKVIQEQRVVAIQVSFQCTQTTMADLKSWLGNWLNLLGFVRILKWCQRQTCEGLK